jgi:hypothetical protein
MSTEEVATRLVELCKGTEWKKAVDELYAKTSLVWNRTQSMTFRRK